MFHRTDFSFIRRMSLNAPQVLQAAERAARIQSDRSSISFLA
jgi:hypothetical protein